MQPSTTQNQTQQLTCPQLPLAVYREVAAHLAQVEEVEASLIIRPSEHEPGAKFDYYQSQVAAIKISYDQKTADRDKQRVEEILEYYAGRYNPWEPVFDEQ